MATANLVEIYCIFDEFCKIFNPELKKHLIPADGNSIATAHAVFQTLKL